MPGGLCDEWTAGVREPKRWGKALTWEGSKSLHLLRKQALEGPLCVGRARLLSGTCRQRVKTREGETSEMTKVCLYLTPVRNSVTSAKERLMCFFIPIFALHLAAKSLLGNIDSLLTPFSPETVHGDRRILHWGRWQLQSQEYHPTESIKESIHRK